MKPRTITGVFIAFLLLQLPLGAMEGDPLEVVVFSNLDGGRIEVMPLLDDAEMEIFRDASVRMRIHYPDGKMETINDKLAGAGTTPSVKAAITPVAAWHPNTPALYNLEIQLVGRDGSTREGSRRFGMRKLESRDGRFHVNNKPFYVRACGHESEYNKYCQTDNRAAIEERLRQVKKYGFNTVRHHSHVPSETYLQVADELGLFVQMEYNRYAKALETDPASPLFEPIRGNWTEMILRGRLHPSTFIYSMGNEIYTNDPVTVAGMNVLYDLAKTLDPGVLVLNRSGSNPFNDDHGKYDLIERPIGEYEHTAEFAREAFMLYLRGDRKGRSDRVPIIAHEYPLVASYPNVALAHRYGEMPAWMKKTLENARAHGLEHLLPLYVKNSEAIQAICRREMLEEARKFRELDGYSMLRFTDCTGMVSGVVNDFADPKNVTAEEFLRTNGETVLLCTWNRRVFHHGDRMETTLEISHHGTEPFSAPRCHWLLMNGPQVLERGTFDSVHVNAVDVAEIGKISIPIPKLPRPAKLILRVYLPDTLPLIENEWAAWAFPREILSPEKQAQVALWDPAKRMGKYTAFYPGFHYVHTKEWKLPDGEPTFGLIIADRWQESFFTAIENGGRIWIVSDKVWPWPEEVGIFGMHLARMVPEQQAPPHFPELDENLTKWLTICSNSEPRQGNSGTLIYPHPALKDFPHDGFCDMQFWPLIYRAKSLKLDEFPPGIDPLIRAIDSYHRGRSKGYMVELAVGRGRLFVSTLNFTQTVERCPAAAYLFNSILEYLTGPDWNPPVHVSVAELRTMLAGYEDKKPALFDELGIRYATHWKKRLSKAEMLVLPIHEAAGADPDRIGVHWEYAQTQWYLAAKPGEALSWDFENKTEAEFQCFVYTGSPLENVPLDIQLDEQEPQRLVFPGSAGFNTFQELDLKIGVLKPGKHTLRLFIPATAPTKEGTCLFLRDVELRALEK